MWVGLKAPAQGPLVTQPLSHFELPSTGTEERREERGREGDWGGELLA